jgi:hypothetical protein
MSQETVGERLARPALMTLTLGLAPFVPEPHVVEKVRRVLAGGADMAMIDWFDLAFHGAPWVWLAYTVVSVLARRAPTPAPAA